ncbi:hypothetical protein Tco_0270797 [Tanacetum coccineum]
MRVSGEIGWTKESLVERENMGLDLTNSDLCPSFIEDHLAKGMGLHVADSHNGNHRKGGFTPLVPRDELSQLVTEYDIPQDVRVLLPKRTQMIFDAPLAYGGEPSIDLLRAFLNLGPAEIDFRSFMMEGIDGEFNFLPEGDLNDEGGSPSTKYVNNEALVIDAEPITTIPPLEFAKNIGDSNDTPSEKDGMTLIGRSVPNESQNPEVDTSSKAVGKRKQVVESSKEGPRRKTQRVPPQASKASDDASDPLDVDSDPDIHEFPSSKELKDSQVVLDNMLNNKTCKLMSTLSKARDSCDVIRKREVKKDKAYAELERKCNEALQDLEKNPIVLDMRSEIETLQGQVDRLHATELVRSDETGLIVAKLVKAAMFHGRCMAFEEVAALKEPFVLEKMSGYRSSSKKEFDQVGDDLATISYPFITKVVVDPYAIVEQLLLKKPKSLFTKPASSHCKPSSSKAPIS